jgi:hypothetical protein
MPHDEMVLLSVRACAFVLRFYSVRAISDQRKHRPGIWSSTGSLSHNVLARLPRMSRGTSSKTFIGAIGEPSLLTPPVPPAAGTIAGLVVGAVYARSSCAGIVVCAMTNCVVE